MALPVSPTFHYARRLAAPSEVVYDAHVSEDALAEWWGPPDSAIDVVSFEARPGGVFHYSYPAGGRPLAFSRIGYEVLDRPVRLRFVSSDADPGGLTIASRSRQPWPMKIANTLGFDSDGQNATIVVYTAKPLGANEAEMQAFRTARAGMELAFIKVYDRLETYLERNGHLASGDPDAA